MMAKNIDWLLKEAYPNEKIVLRAHNGHVRFGGSDVYKSMGAWLKERHGGDLYVVGFAFRRGEVRAVGMKEGRGRGPGVHTVPPSPEGSGDAVLSAASIPLFYLDLRSVLGDSALGKWLADSHQFWSIGALYFDDNPQQTMVQSKLRSEYDGLIFVEEGRAARAIP